ncbi:formimidoyltransferase-cyclodeaminase-like [Penaeus chinensis]|uniref:formimidoyltransferase-cyclodeaminase-like n=1 Tax=Penaeus chinensis TaxID=139456 RepID=UPI001FB5FD06|nr:formimidoyltransferase-cyclodeaminase-like [Penaeus chinensis]
MSRQLVACMLNVSEARRKDVVEKIAKEALAAVNPPRVKPISSDWAINATVLNIFQDIDYNRSVITLVSSEDCIGPCVEAACEKAYELIDLSHHEGVHPRLGAVDLVPLHPISEGVSLPNLGQVARGTLKYHQTPHGYIKQEMVCKIKQYQYLSLFLFLLLGIMQYHKIFEISQDKAWCI